MGCDTFGELAGLEVTSFKFGSSTSRSSMGVRWLAFYCEACNLIPHLLFSFLIPKSSTPHVHYRARRVVLLQHGHDPQSFVNFFFLSMAIHWACSS